MILQKRMKFKIKFQAHKCAWPFIDPVDANEVPDYYNVIKEPMGELNEIYNIKNSPLIVFPHLDLKQIESKILDHDYDCLNDFIKDMTKVFDNCRYYNHRESAFYKCAEELEAFFIQKLNSFREVLVKN